MSRLLIISLILLLVSCAKNQPIVAPTEPKPVETIKVPFPKPNGWKTIDGDTFEFAVPANFSPTTLKSQPNVKFAFSRDDENFIAVFDYESFTESGRTYFSSQLWNLQQSGAEIVKFGTIDMHRNQTAYVFYGAQSSVLIIGFTFTEENRAYRIICASPDPDVASSVALCSSLFDNFHLRSETR